MQLTKMHDYKGFTIEPIPGGFNIVMYGIKHILYIAGPSGWRLTEDMREARAFRDPLTCHNLIDEMIADWQGWIDSCKGTTPPIDLTTERKGIQQEQVLQPGSKLPATSPGIKYSSSVVL